MKKRILKFIKTSFGPDMLKDLVTGAKTLIGIGFASAYTAASASTFFAGIFTFCVGVSALVFLRSLKTKDKKKRSKKKSKKNNTS